MSRGEPQPLIDESYAVHLASVINRVAASFDVAELSPDEAAALYTLLDHLTDTLWREHKHVLLPLYKNLLARLDLSDFLDADEPDEPEGTPQ